jgi:hypothetical protein
MTRRPIRIAGAALAASGAATLALLAPAASAAVLGDVVYLVGAALGGEGAPAQFGTASKADASMAALPSTWIPSGDTAAPTAAEIVGESGWAIAPSEVPGYALQGWDVTSGAFLSTIPISIGASPLLFPPGPDGYVQVSVFGLDSVGGVLQTGVCLATIYADESTEAGCFLGTLGTDGLFTATVDLDPEDLLETIPTSIATDPISGTTYVFLMNDDNYSSALVVSGGVVVDWIDLVGLETAVQSSNFPLGADFDGAGTLWIVFGINNLEEYHLFSYPTGSSIESTEPTDIGGLDYGTTLNFVTSAALTVGDPVAPTVPAASAAPALPGTGSSGTDATAAVLGAIGGVMLVGGAIVLAATRRRSVS